MERMEQRCCYPIVCTGRRFWQHYVTGDSARTIRSLRPRPAHMNVTRLYPYHRAM